MLFFVKFLFCWHSETKHTINSRHRKKAAKNNMDSCVSFWLSFKASRFLWKISQTRYACVFGPLKWPVEQRIRGTILILTPEEVIYPKRLSFWKLEIQRMESVAAYRALSQVSCRFWRIQSLGLNISYFPEIVHLSDQVQLTPSLCLHKYRWVPVNPNRVNWNYG